MAWRGSSTPKDRILACLVYLVPMLEVLGFGFALFQQFPWFEIPFVPLYPLAIVYFYAIGGLQVVALAVFFGLYLGIVRNESLRHFLRFNAMQSLLIAIVVFLFRALLGLFGLLVPVVPNALVAATNLPFLLTLVFNTVFLGVLAACIYSIVQSVRGLYAEIPVISEAAYMQTRF
jgi:uncharacterized membrane protein